MPQPDRAPAFAPPARKLTPVPPATAKAPGLPPPLPGRGPLAASRSELEASVDSAFDHLVAPGASGPAPKATSAADLAALQGTYLELAVEYCAPVRNVMLEVRWGAPPLLWLEQVRAPLLALRRMSVAVELAALTSALEGFDSALGAVLVSGETTLSAAGREQLLAAYGPLAQALPRAFDLDGERDRREPIILRSLLRLVPGLSPLAVERFFAAGLVRLENLGRARADEVAVVTGLDAALAAEVVALVRAEGALAADLDVERERLATLTARMDDEHRALERAAAGWSGESQAEKRGWRRQREQSWLRIKISLARLGETEGLDRLERLPFARKLEALEGFLRAGPRPGAREGQTAIAT